MMASRRALTLSLALAAGCTTVSKVTESAEQLRLSGERSAVSQKVFSIDWRACLSQDDIRPYKPLLPGRIALDPDARVAFAVTEDGILHAVAAPQRGPTDPVTEKPRFLWQHALGAASDGGPTYADGTVYVATGQGRAHAFSAENGKVRWLQDLREEILTAPTLSDDTLFVVSVNNTLMALNRENGVVRWRYRRDGGPDLSLRGAARPLVADDRVFAGFADGFAVALGASDGIQIWERRLAEGLRFIDVDADPVTDGAGTVYFAAATTGVFALSAEDGRLLWHVPEPGATALAYDSRARLVFAGGSKTLAAFDGETGDLVWRITLPPKYSIASLAVSSKLLLAAMGEGPLLMVDLGTGKFRKRFDPGRGIAATPSVEAPGHAFVVSNRGCLYDLRFAEGAH